MKRYRLKEKLKVKNLLRTIEQLTITNTETRAAFEAKCQSRWVIIQGEGDAPDVTGHVIAFLPERVLRVMDDRGEIRITSVDQIEEDVHRRLYGKSNKQYTTELHPAHAA